MKKLTRLFIIKIIILTLIIATISTLLFFFLLTDNYFPSFPFILLMFPIVSIIVHTRLLRASQKSLSSFNIAFMLSFIIKLFVYLGVSATVLSLENENKTIFVIMVLLLYVIYTVFDVNRILLDMKKINAENRDQMSE